MTKPFAATLLLALAATALAQDQGAGTRPTPNAPPVEVWSARPGVGSAKRKSTMTAKVMAVDAEKRLVSLETPQGGVQVMQVGDSVKRLQDVAPGDTITVKYEQKLTLEYQPEGTPAIEKSATASGTRGAADQPPSGTATTQVQGTVKVVKVDPLYRIVTLQDEQGQKYQVRAGADIDFVKVKVGQQYLATFIETLAVELKKTAVWNPKASPKGAPASSAPLPAR